jgi:CheY-like chemotaxis protein
MDGHAATMVIRKAGDSVPIVGLTGNALDEQRVEFLACGADAVLKKPLSHSQFEHSSGVLKSRCTTKGTRKAT